MKYDWIDEFLLAKVGVTKDFQSDWGWIRYKLGDKMFASICLDSDGKPYYITLKLEPSLGIALREQYEDVIPGYYMNKLHWNSVKADGNVPDEAVRAMLECSYYAVLSTFSQKKQAEITGE